MIEGLDEPRLNRLVSRFYAEVRDDPLLGPLFNRAHQASSPQPRVVVC